MLRSQARRRRPAALRRTDEATSLRGASASRPAPLTAVPAQPESLSPERRQHQRFVVAAHLSAQLAPLQSASSIAEHAVNELHTAFQYHLAVIQRLEGELLHVVSAAGPLASDPEFLAWTQSIHEGVNGRVVRTGELAFVPDTRVDPDYLRRDSSSDPGSELSLPISVDGRIWGVLNLEQQHPNAFDADDVLLAEAVCSQVGAALHRADLAAEVEATVTNTLGTLIDVLEAKDAYTAQHARDVVDLSERVARRLGLSEREVRDVHYAAILHDIGKIAVPSDILRKPSGLTDEEFEVIKTHSDVGGRLLERIPFTRSVAPLVRAIHERFDGGGYPDQLDGQRIPIGARIVGACDAFDAMVSDRPYRSGMPFAAALTELRRCAGSQFDPAVVEALIAELATDGRAAAAR